MTMNTKGLVGMLAGLGCLVALAGVASATPTAVLQLADGNDKGPQGEDTGPGAEQADVMHMSVGGDEYLVTVWMSSESYTNNAPWQCHCSSIKLNADGPPELVASNVQLTDYNDDRACNHPRVASNGADEGVLVYGSDDNAANPRTYVHTLDHMCNMGNQRLRISNDNNNNEGAPDMKYVGGNMWVAGYLSTNNNDRSVAVGVSLENGQLAKEWQKTVVAPSNIGRPAIMPFEGDKALFCASRGDNRPPEDGVQCALLNASNGDIYWKEYIAESDPGNDVYMNQPSIAALDYGRFQIHVLESSGLGKITNIKGSNVAHDYIIEPNLTGFQLKDHIVGAGSYQTHSSICGGAYGVGEEAQQVAGLFGAPITGNGQPVLQMARYNTTTGLTVDKAADKWIVGWFGDSGYLANLYGENPGSEGRNFLRCRGNVPNPGFGVENGYMPSVKSFFAVPHDGRVPGEEKNSQFISLIPGETSKILEPGAPLPAGEIPLGEEGEQVEGDPIGPSADDPIDQADPTNPSGGNDDPTEFPDNNTAACACSTVGAPSNSTTGGAGALALLGLALSFMSRRRREEG